MSQPVEKSSDAAPASHLDSGSPALSAASSTTASAHGTAPPSASSRLPPEALALATRLFDAARTGDTVLLGQALASGLKPNMTNAKGDTLLMLAAYHGHLATTELLLGQGADPNTLNGRGQSPLAGAVFKNEAAIVEALVRGGADPDRGRPSAREAAVMFKNEALLGVLEEAEERRSGQTRLHGDQH